MALGCNCNLVLPGCRRFESACSDFFWRAKRRLPSERHCFVMSLPSSPLTQSYWQTTNVQQFLPSHGPSIPTTGHDQITIAEFKCDVISCADDPSKISSREIIFEEYLIDERPYEMTTA